MKKMLLGGGAILLLFISTISVVAATNNRVTNIKSQGVLKYTNGNNFAEIDSSDLRYLANEIDDLESYYKETATSSLSVVSAVVPNNEWSSICNSIAHSQDVDTPSIADNISAGKQAWVAGEMITGNGADVKTAYNQGYADGMQKAIGSAQITYTYHQHVTADGTVGGNVIYSNTNPGGCYKASGHTHDKTGTCAKTPVYGHVCDSGCHYVEAGYEWVYDDNDDGEDTHGWHKKWVPAHTDHSSNQGIVSYTYACGNYTNTWKPECGRTAGKTIDKAEIVYP